MSLFKEILNESFLLTEDVSPRKVNIAIDGLHPASIQYNSGGENKATGYRVIYPIAYGISTAGNPVVRAFETGGDTKTSVPAWKLFRLDRVISWKTLNREFNPNDPALQGGFQLMNPDGDETMAQVLNISPIGNAKNLYRRTEMPGEVDDKPITKQDIDNSGVKLANPVKSAEYSNNYTPNDAIDAVLSGIKDNEPENLDNGIEKSYNNIGNTGKESEPITKTQIEPNVGKEDPVQQTNTNLQLNTPVNQSTVDNEPVTKDDIEGEEEDNKKNNELTNSYNDMLRRMDNLNKEEENGSI